MEHLTIRTGYDASPTPGRSTGDRTRSPQHRPPTAIRVLAGLLGIASLLFNVALMLSDRAPRLTRRVLGGFQRRLSERIDAGGEIPLAANEHLPEGDAIVHIGVWAVAVILVGLTIWSWRGLAVAAIGVFAASVATEIGQGRFSQTRSVESGDILANATGIAVGVAITACAYLAWSSVASLITKSGPTAHR